MLQTSRADAHKSRAQCTQNAVFLDVLHSSAETPWTLGAHLQWRMRARSRAMTSLPPPPPVFEISTWNRFTPLHEMECDAVIVRDSIVRHVRATLAEGKVHTYCFPGARVLDVSAQIPAILKGDESPRAVVLHAGVNDTTLRQMETTNM
uniref:Uncharacterized protein n=1 Tax=Cyprinus carpio carpio TaxID=630221 RepID=A0A9J8BNF0_CYPCA